MVFQKRADTLYNGVKEVISDHLELVAETEVVPAFVKTTDNNARMSADAGTSFLMTLKRVWNDHTTSMLMIRDILMYMVGNTLKPHYFSSSSSAGAYTKTSMQLGQKTC